jgi:hypothetical protein
MRLTVDFVAAGPDEEVEVSAGIGLHDMVYVQLFPTTDRSSVRS